VKGQHVLITGAGGSIGSQLCQQVIEQGAERLTLVSLTESGLYDIDRKLRALGSPTLLVPVLGSVVDRDLMNEVCDGVDVVIHAAAHKHVPICEHNPLAAIDNNVRGTLTLANAAILCDVKSFVLISTDKAVRPASIMGATKRVAEMIVSAKGQQSRSTVFSTVRFGNVLDSAGSVLPLWREQIAKGGPITLTDARCTRYFMSIPEACWLVLCVLKMGKPGTFVLNMGEPRSILHMAERLIADSGKECAIKYIGLRPGEKLEETLHFGGELMLTENPQIFSVVEPQSDWRRSMVDDLLAATTCRNQSEAVGLLRHMTRDLMNHAA
jgi:FlaA1/EpsC-like NDP-sugar epimerase